MYYDLKLSVQSFLELMNPEKMGKKYKKAKATPVPKATPVAKEPGPSKKD